MLTRKSIRAEMIRDDDDVDWDEVMSRTPEQEAAADAEFERETDTWIREHNARMARMTTLERYRYERHFLVVSMLRTRDYQSRFIKLNVPSFLIDQQIAYLKKKQTDCLGWRHFLRTGIMPSMEKQ